MLVFGFEDDADVVSRIIGVTPTKVWRRGEKVTPRVIKTHQENGWALESPTDPTQVTLEGSIAALVACFPDRGVFHHLPPGVQKQITCVIYAYTERPSVSLSAALVGAIAELGVDLDIDIYDLTSAERDPEEH